MRKLYLLILFIVSNTLYAQEQIVYKTNNLPKPDTVWVFIPKTVKSKENLPLVYLLNGYGGNHKQWNNIMDAQKYADRYGFIVVCPDGLTNSWYVNSPEDKSMQYQDFFFKELFPDIIRKYNPDKRNIFISGLSMGGHGALNIFLKHPELFKSAGSTSGVVDLRGSKKSYDLIGLLGEGTDENPNWLKQSVVGNVEILKDTDKEFIFDCGAEDTFYASNKALKDLCDSLKIKATFISQPGAHNRAYWTKSIAQHFEFFKSKIN